jgi:iron complex transport system ATP-binding protein
VKNETLIVAKGLCFEIAGKRIVDQVTLRGRQGDFIGVIGPNGAGKTTLLRLLGGTLQPSSGSVMLDGRPVNKMHPRDIARFIATGPQDPRLDFTFSVRQVVLMGRHPHLGRFEVESQHDFDIVEAAIDQLGIADLADRIVTTLSRGERQMVFIAKALAQEPRVVLLDEPLAALDIRHQLEVLALFHHLSRQGLIVIAVLHDLNLAARFCDWVMLMDNGRKVATGTPREVLTVQNMQDTYRVPAVIREDDLTGAVSVTALQPVGANQNPRSETMTDVSESASGAFEVQPKLFSHLDR